MAKDPAFLFYYQDFLVGTDEFTNEEVGAYIRCLCFQAAKGGITENHMKNICKSQANHEIIKKKFIWFPEEELFRNERLMDEIVKRKKYCESRSNNKKGKKHMKIISKSYDSHMENENENENEYVLGERREGAGEKKEGNPFPGFPLPNHLNGLPEIKIGAAIELIQITKQKKVTNDDVIGMWDVFKVQNLTGKKFYQDEGAVHSHFINWIKKQEFLKSGLAKGNKDPMEDDARNILKQVNKR